MTDPTSVEAELQDPHRIDAEHASDTVAPDEAVGLTFSLKRTVDLVMGSLTPTEKKILEMRRSLAKDLITQERIREIEAKAMAKLRRGRK